MLMNINIIMFVIVNMGKNINFEEIIKTYIMNATVITKTLRKVEQQPSEYSLGFRRLEALPSRVRFNFGLASNLNNNWDGAKAHEEQLNFLENLTEQEFVNWMKIN